MLHPMPWANGDLNQLALILSYLPGFKHAPFCYCRMVVGFAKQYLLSDDGVVLMLLTNNPPHYITPQEVFDYVEEVTQLCDCGQFICPSYLPSKITE